MRMRGRTGEMLLRLPVRTNDIQLGWPVDLTLDLASARALGADVVCGDDAIRFLPLAAAELREDEIAVGSPLTLLDDRSFYRERASTLRALRGAAVERAGETLGQLRDVVVGAAGQISALVVERDGGLALVELDPQVRVVSRAAVRTA